MPILFSPESINDSLKKLAVTNSKEIDYYKKLNKFLVCKF